MFKNTEIIFRMPYYVHLFALILHCTGYIVVVYHATIVASVYG